VADEFVLDTQVVRAFVADVRRAIDASSSPGDACERIRPSFAALLADGDWLPAAYQEPVPDSGMGGGIGQWLLFRAGDGSLSLFALVVPSCSATPVHDHLAWGLVGLYRGSQDEEIYERSGDDLELAESRALERGDFYALIPPRADIHRVRTTSPDASVSIHLLTNDTGCVWRHSYDPESGAATPFRSG
jgi:3-mercaptopropionate dioxygenase